MFKRFKYVLIFSLLLSCGKHQDKGGDDGLNLEEIRAEAKRKLSTLVRDEYGFIGDCDGLTFSSLLDAFTDESVDLLQAKDVDGRWFRHPRKNCYATGASRSSISRDGFLMLFHALYERGDIETLKQIREYGRDHRWIMGEGGKDYVWLGPFRPLLNDLIKDLKLTSEVRDDDGVPYFKGFRAHLIAMYVWLQGKRKGYINSVEKAALEKIVSEDETNPLFKALINRFTTGDQGDVRQMLRSFPAVDTGVFGWGSCPNAVFYNLVLAAMEGR